MELDSGRLPVHNNEIEHRFEIEAGGELAILTYMREEGRIVYVHTSVPAPLEGHGIAGQLAMHALEYARAEGLLVAPLCPYIRGYIERHPEYEDLVAAA